MYTLSANFYIKSMLCINLKTYSGNSGKGTFDILDQIRQFSIDFPEFNSKYAFCPNNIQLESVSSKYPTINIIAQSVDPIELGKTTGWVPAELLKLINVKYTLFNHSEHRIYDENINKKINFIKQFGINVIVCCENIEEAKRIMESKPYAIAYEPPELIGSDISVSTQKPEIVEEFVNLLKGTCLPFIGAGITCAEDIRIGSKLGAKGYIIAKAFLDAPNKYEKLKEFIQVMG